MGGARGQASSVTNGTSSGGVIDVFVPHGVSLG
jgi:hypothetical protein